MNEYSYEYFIDRAGKSWGSKIEDDKYFEDEELEDNFIAFYCYAFAWLELPAPSVAQINLARFISDREHPHRMVMAMRGLS